MSNFVLGVLEYKVHYPLNILIEVGREYDLVNTNLIGKDEKRRIQTQVSMKKGAVFSPNTHGPELR